MDAMAASGEYGELVFAGKPINRADFERVVVNREDDAEVGKKSIRISRLRSSTTGIIRDRSTRTRSVNGSIR